MSFDGAQPHRRGGNAFGMSHLVVRVLWALYQRLAAWRFTQRPGSRPDTVVIGTLKRSRLAITMRATVVRAESTPPPLPVFLERLVAHPLSPYWASRR
jgi:hypothetical protein